MPIFVPPASQIVHANLSILENDLRSPKLDKAKCSRDIEMLTGSYPPQLRSEIEQIVALWIQVKEADAPNLEELKGKVSALKGEVKPLMESDLAAQKTAKESSRIAHNFMVDVINNEKENVSSYFQQRKFSKLKTDDLGKIYLFLKKNEWCVHSKTGDYRKKADISPGERHNFRLAANIFLEALPQADKQKAVEWAELNANFVDFPF